ncbi:MAG: hypothetical protein LIP02_11525, partial [Bacteroidales bacterium]|nr:hypothetical protein [Bacteroidales bacterium]
MKRWYLFYASTDQPQKLEQAAQTSPQKKFLTFLPEAPLKNFLPKKQQETKEPKRNYYHLQNCVLKDHEYCQGEQCYDMGCRYSCRAESCGSYSVPSHGYRWRAATPMAFIIGRGTHTHSFACDPNFLGGTSLHPDGFVFFSEFTS